MECFPANVFLATKPANILYPLNVLDGELSCMDDLIRMNKTWKYYINLTGEEFPLVTNFELVTVLSKLHGVNFISG